MLEPRGTSCTSVNSNFNGATCRCFRNDFWPTIVRLGWRCLYYFLSYFSVFSRTMALFCNVDESTLVRDSLAHWLTFHWLLYMKMCDHGYQDWHRKTLYHCKSKALSCDQGHTNRQEAWSSWSPAEESVVYFAFPAFLSSITFMYFMLYTFYMRSLELMESCWRDSKGFSRTSSEILDLKRILGSFSLEQLPSGHVQVIEP